MRLNLNPILWNEKSESVSLHQVSKNLVNLKLSSFPNPSKSSSYDTILFVQLVEHDE